MEQKELDPKEVARRARELTKKLAAAGKVVEGGWAGYRILMDPRAGQIQIEETRMAFYAGCQHLFSSILTILDSGTEPTDNDFAQLTAIKTELDEFIEEYRRKHGLKG